MIDPTERAVRAAALRQQRIHVETKAPREHQQQHADEHREMASHVRRRVDRSALPLEARRQRVEQNDGERHDDHAQQRPRPQRVLERKPVDEEAEVGAEVRIERRRTAAPIAPARAPSNRRAEWRARIPSTADRRDGGAHEIAARTPPRRSRGCRRGAERRATRPTVAPRTDCRTRIARRTSAEPTRSVSDRTRGARARARRRRARRTRGSPRRRRPTRGRG